MATPPSGGRGVGKDVSEHDYWKMVDREWRANVDNIKLKRRKLAQTTRKIYAYKSGSGTGSGVDQAVPSLRWLTCAWPGNYC